MQLKYIFKIKHYRKLAILPLCIISGHNVAGDLTVETSVETTAYVYDTKRGESEAESNQAIAIEPSILAFYSSKRLLTSFAADHTKVNQKNDIAGADKNYTDYKYDGKLVLIPKTLNISISAQQGYRVVNQQQEFVVDKILAAGDLTKFNNKLASVDFTIPNPKYFGLNIRSTYSETDSDESIDGSVGINGDNTASSIQLYQGKNARNYTFNLAASMNNTSRSNLEDFKSSKLQGSAGISIIHNMSFILNGNIDDYDVNSDSLVRRTDLDSTSYGAGFEWQPTGERKLRLTYNRLEEGGNETNFVGVNLDWVFSSRTALKFDYGKRFYGDAYNLDFSHALKSVRTSITYSEEVTSFARLVNTINPIGLFVCQFGSSELTDCFQPDTATYQLQAGEEFRTLSEISSDISEEIIFRKAGSFNLTYQKRRIKASISASYGRTEYLESDRLQTNRNIRLNLSYALGRRTDLNFSTTVARNSNNNDTPDNIIRADLNLERALSRNLKFTAGLGIVNRDSDVIERNIEDKRLTVSLGYKF